MSAASAFTDQELAILLKQGDREAFTQIYHRYKALLYAHAYNKLRDREETIDLLQDLFSQLWTNRERMQIDTTLAAYLYGMIRNKVLKLIRHKAVGTRYIDSIKTFIEESSCETDHLVRERQLAHIIEKEIDALPEKMREVFLMSRKLKMSHKQIADQLGIAEPTVKKHVNSALKVLRSRLGLFAWIILLIRY